MQPVDGTFPLLKVSFQGRKSINQERKIISDPREKNFSTGSLLFPITDCPTGSAVRSYRGMGGGLWRDRLNLTGSNGMDERIVGEVFYLIRLNLIEDDDTGEWRCGSLRFPIIDKGNLFLKEE